MNAEDNTAGMPEKRRLPLEGLLNTRELGGYPVTAGGGHKTVKKGLIYRSGSPENLTGAGQKKLEGLKIKTTVDFRSSGEKSASFNFPTLVKSVNCPIDAGNLMSAFLKSGKWAFSSSVEKSKAEMISLYTILPIEAIPHYRVLFSLLADSSSAPLLYYCSAGKDRTGVASALILHALGASMDTILDDYLCSTENLRPYWEQFAEAEPYMIPYYTVTKEYLLTAFKAIENYGGMDNYLTRELGADIKHLRNLYLE